MPVYPHLTDEHFDAVRARAWTIAHAQGVTHLSDIDPRGLDDFEVRRYIVHLREIRAASEDFLGPDPLELG